VHPAAAEHGRHDLDVDELFDRARHRVPIEHYEVGQKAGQ
jgi:hypothetical protein